MYIVIKSGRDTNLPPMYRANSPTIAQHPPRMEQPQQNLGNMSLITLDTH